MASAAGAVIFDEKNGALRDVRARAVLLATGGLGRVFKETTNPDVATGDGVAMAWRAGAEIGNIEFVQFHPTALHVEGAPRFLLSEALRGEGAVLRNKDGEAFMQRYHPLMDLAPRDVVSRSIVAEMRRTGSPHVWLDLTSRDADFIRHRFPRIYETCLAYGRRYRARARAGASRRALRDGRRAVRSRRPQHRARPLCRGRSGLHRRARRQSPGQQFAARSGGLRPARGPGDEVLMRSEQHRRVHREPAADAGAGDHASARSANLTWEHCGIVRDRAGLESALAHAGPHRMDAGRVANSGRRRTAQHASGGGADRGLRAVA